VSLQGSFETISLRDVMTLLASSRKSGELRVVGGQMQGRVWLVDGDLVASKVGKSEDHADALFELLRLADGTFVFKDGLEAPEPAEATPIEPVLRLAERRLAEWQDVQLVVPSLEHRVRLVPDLPATDVTLTAEEWHLVMAVALSATVRGVLEELGLGQLEGCKGIKGLVDAGLVIVEPPRVRPATSSDSGRAGRRLPVGAGSRASADESVRPPRLLPRPAVSSFGLTAALLPDSSDEDSDQVSYQSRAEASGPSPAGRASLSPVSYESTFDDEDRYAGGAVSLAGPTRSPFDDSGFGHQLGFAPSEDVSLPGYGEVTHLDGVIEAPRSSRFEALGAYDYEAPDGPEASDSPHQDDVRVPLVGAESDFERRPYSAPTPDYESEPSQAASQDREPGGDSINRGLLLKFLSSVRS
jgi:hypothetical protein